MKAEPPDKVIRRARMVRPNFISVVPHRAGHSNLYAGGPMDKYIGFDIDSNKTSVCVVQKNMADRYATIGPDAGSMREVSGKREEGWFESAFDF